MTIIVKKGLWYFEIIDTKTNTIIGTQETYSKAKKVLEKEKNDNHS